MPTASGSSERIDGNTLLFATLGNPVSQVRLPTVMGPVFAHLGLNAVWVPMHTPDGALGAVLGTLRSVTNFRGVTVTVPHKMAVMGMVDHLSRRAEAAGTANLIRREPDGTLLADMVDGAGFVRGLKQKELSVQGSTVWVVGGGGAGAAIVAALSAGGADRIWLTEADPARASALAERVRRHYPATPVEVVGRHPPARPDFAVNATPCGLRPDDPLPFNPAELAGDVVVCDIIMKPKETALLRAARERGMHVHHGHHMLDTQIPMYLEFLGIAIPDADEVIRIASLAGG
jgi:shikimate dehydrogenase